ncbi:MAG: hypothetical protein ACK4V2_04530 [Pseudomonadota bacterium]|jgi:hypothetical protein|nr:hypothetical protein [Alphaproteobacteria bacterium]
MGIQDIPQKIIEKRGSFNESQLATALELTKLVCQSTKSADTQDKVMNIFFFFYNNIKEITPPPLDKKINKKYLVIIISIFTVMVCIAAYYFLLH